ncbi:hypothetical protein ACOMHN_030143 [Nucella lapillus]
MARCCPFTKCRTIIAIVLLVVSLHFLLSRYLLTMKTFQSQIAVLDVFQLLHSGNREAEQGPSEKKCVHPVLHPWDPLIMQHHRKIPVVVNCTPAMKDLVYTTNSTFHISRDATRLHGKITCQYMAVQRKGDFSVTYGPVIKPILDGTPLQSDFFNVSCTSSSGKKYYNFHATAARNAAIVKRLRDYHSSASQNGQKTRPDPGPLSQSLTSANLNVFMFGFDGVSRMAWMRLLPKSRRYFLDRLGGIELENYNIVAEGTIGNLLPMLTGKTEKELPDAARGHKGAKPVDSFPWIWKNFSQRGYVTAYAEDYHQVGTFQWRMMGFDQQPTDHYMRPFHIAASSVFSKNIAFCLGSLKRHIVFMNWFRDLYDTYKEFPKFLFGFNAEMSHDSNHNLAPVDDDLKMFLQDLEAKGSLDSTVLILMSDHGAKYGSIRASDIGKLEERLPYFSFRFPPWFQKHHPDIIKTIRTNAKRLTTPFDIHATFHDILKRSWTSAGRLDNRSFSLFQEVPKERTCADAAIYPHWCACVEWETLNTADPLVVLAVDKAIRAINTYTQFKRKQCAELKLLIITKTIRYARKTKENWKVLKFANKTLPATADLYQVSFKTVPGEGHYEVTCAVIPENSTVLVDANEISRINRYGSQPACVQEHFPLLRPYCYCH